MHRRWECVDCGSHTLMDECVNCGSTNLRLVRETPGDITNADLPPSPGAKRWQHDMLENPGHYRSVRSIRP